MATTEVRNQRVVDYLRKLYGRDPEPLRSYLTQDEVKNICFHFNLPAYEAVTRDLDLTGYACRWRNAVENQIREDVSPATWAFWHNARLYFLELGGCYKFGHQPPANE